MYPEDFSRRYTENIVRGFELGGPALALALPLPDTILAVNASPEAVALQISLDTLGRFILFANTLRHTFLDENKGEKEIGKSEGIFRAAIKSPLMAFAQRLAPSVIAKTAFSPENNSPIDWVFFCGIVAITTWELGKTIHSVNKKIISPIRANLEKPVPEEVYVERYEIKKPERETVAAAPSIRKKITEPTPLPDKTSSEVTRIITEYDLKIEEVKKTFPNGNLREHHIGRLEMEKNKALQELLGKK